MPSNGFMSRINSKSFSILPKQLINSEFTKYTSKGTKKLGYQTLDGFFKQIKKSIKSSDKKKYIYAYWPTFDSLNHKFGVGSKKSEKHFKEIDDGFERFFNNYQKNNGAPTHKCVGLKQPLVFRMLKDRK